MKVCAKLIYFYFRLQIQSTIVEHKDGGAAGGIFKSYTIIKVIDAVIAVVFVSASCIC